MVVSVLNLKGGVGKTTVAALLARYASGTGGFQMEEQKNLDVLAVDLDPQANLSQALMGEAGYLKFMNGGEPSVVELFKAPNRMRAENVVKTTANNPDVIPSRFDFSDNLIESLRADEKVLDAFLRREMAHKDLVIIDCAPTESIMTRAAYYASHYVLIPVRTEFLATIGFPLMHQSLKNFRDGDGAHDIKVCVLINSTVESGGDSPNYGPHHRAALKDIRRRAGEYKWPVLYRTLWHSRGYPKWVKEPNPSHLGNAAEEWPPIAEEILQMTGLACEMPASGHQETLDNNFHKEIEADKSNYMSPLRGEVGRILNEEGDSEELREKCKEARAKAAERSSVVKLLLDYPDSVKNIAAADGTQWEKCTRIGVLVGELVAAIEEGEET